MQSRLIRKQHKVMAFLTYEIRYSRTLCSARCYKMVMDAIYHSPQLAHHGL